MLTVVNLCVILRKKSLFSSFFYVKNGKKKKFAFFNEFSRP